MQSANEEHPADYWGEDWDQQTASQKPKSGQAPSKSDPGKGDQKQPAAGSGRSAKDSSQRPAEDISADSVWSLVVATFTEGDHVAAAQTMINESRTIAPQVKNLRVHPTTKGAMVVFGDYTGRDDPQARKDIDWLKSIRYQNRPVFSRVIITNLDLRPLKGDLHAYDLLSARKAHPKVNPLYTLDIAIWDDFDSGQMTYAEIKRKSEAYAMQLRQQGYEAYFYHDGLNERSTVTVGLFDRTAINPTSGLYTSAVTDLVKKFPQRLVNGEPMFEYDKPYENKRAKDKDRIKTKPQTPVLALVPDL